jgi:hypothetical protein
MCFIETEALLRAMIEFFAVVTGVALWNAALEFQKLRFHPSDVPESRFRLTVYAFPVAYGPKSVIFLSPLSVHR